MPKVKTREQIEFELKQLEQIENKEIEMPAKPTFRRSEWLKEEEWKEILKYHNILYYPMNQEMNAEATFYEARKWFQNRDDKPKFCNVTPRVAKLEAEYDKLIEMLSKFDLTKKEQKEIEARLRVIRKKLRIV